MKLKRIIGLCQVVLAVAILLLWFLPCLVINPYGSVLKTLKYTGFEAYLGAASGFSASVFGITEIILLGIIVVLALVKVFLPKLSIIWNLCILLFSVVATVILCYGNTTYLVESKADIIGKYEAFSSVNLGVGAILGICVGILIAASAIVDEVIAYKNK